MKIETHFEQLKYRRYIRWWFWSGAFLVGIMVVVGGITRLTGSGLSMTDWSLLMGAIPPLSEAAWEQVFSRYKQFPEYQFLNSGMTLAEFKAIFFWEYLHRLLGRLIGVAFLLPFLWFWFKGQLTQRLFRRALLLFLLGAAQGGMGWFMVKSGLVDVPAVSHYRLAAHLMLAFLIVGFCVWYALDMESRSGKGFPGFVSRSGWWVGALGLILTLQIVWGAFVAGLDAGYIYNSFPMMNESWLPANFLALEPALLNFAENPGTVQWIHRILGTLLLVMTFFGWQRLRAVDNKRLKFRMHLLLVLILLQYGIGIGTVLYAVPVALGVLHQALALFIWMVWIAIAHQMVKTKN